jgi:hypothetical protein
MHGAILEQTATKAIAYCAESIAEIGQNTYKISGYMDDVEKTNPGLLDEISEFLKY